MKIIEIEMMQGSYQAHKKMHEASFFNVKVSVRTFGLRDRGSARQKE